MARKRIIDPDFWSDEELADMRFETRLLYIGMWNFADDAGNLPAKPRQIRAQVFPHNPEVDIEGCLAELMGAKKVILYAVNGEKYLHLPNFLKHQAIKKPTFKYPAFREEFRTSTAPVPNQYHTSTEPVPHQFPTSSPEKKRREEKEIEEKEEKERARAREENPPPTKPPGGYDPTSESRDEVVKLIQLAESFFGAYPFTYGQIGDGRAEAAKEELASVLRLLTAEEVMNIVEREYHKREKESQGVDRPRNLLCYMKPIKEAFYNLDRQLEEEERRRDEEKKQRKRDPASENPVPIADLIEEELSDEDRAKLKSRISEIREKVVKAGGV